MFQNLYLDCYITGSSQPPGQEASGTYQGREIEGFLRLNESPMDTMTTYICKSQHSFFWYSVPGFSTPCSLPDSRLERQRVQSFAFTRQYPDSVLRGLLVPLWVSTFSRFYKNPKEKWRVESGPGQEMAQQMAVLALTSKRVPKLHPRTTPGHTILTPPSH